MILSYKSARSLGSLPHATQRSHVIAFFKRHAEGDPKQSAPGYDFVSACPVKVEATMYAVHGAYHSGTIVV